MKNYTTRFLTYTAEDWANLLTKKLDLDIFYSYLLLHDLRNLRAGEWVEIIEEEILDEDIIEAFKIFINYHNPEEDEEE